MPPTKSYPTHQPEPLLPPDTRVYAIGDIHGRLDLLNRLLIHIRDDAQSAPTRKVLLILGDMVDHGPQSAGVIERLSTLKTASAFHDFEITCLKGNHEAMMLTFLDERNDRPEIWLENDGATTLKSYGIADNWTTPDIARARLRKAIPPEHRRFLDHLGLYHQEGDFVFVHAGLRPGVALQDQSEDDLLWIRDGFIGCEDQLRQCVVHGHTPVGVPEVVPRRIAVDTRAWLSGHLTSFVGEGCGVKFITT